MEALTALQQRFVLAMASDPLATPSEWARAAGYGAERKGGHDCRLNPKIEAAAQELARAHLNTFGPVLGVGVMMMIARNPEHKDQLKAASALANRAGFHETSEHMVKVEHTDRTGKALVERIKLLAAGLGMDPSGLLGVNAAPKLIEGEVVDAKNG